MIGACTLMYMDVSQNSGFSPPNHPLINSRFSIIFTIHFGVSHMYIYIYTYNHPLCKDFDPRAFRSSSSTTPTANLVGAQRRSGKPVEADRWIT